MTAPVLFLDFDGVLNGLAYLRAFHARRREIRAAGTTAPPWRVSRGDPGCQAGGGCHELDPAAIARLNTVVARTRARVVVSSAWRIGESVAWLRRLLAAHGAAARVLGKTCDPWAVRDASGAHVGSSRRGEEIQRWLDAHPEVTRFAIVDDEADMVHLSGRLVRTDYFAGGLQDEHVERLCALLGEGGDAR